MPASASVDRFTSRTLRGPRELSPLQRADAVEAILRAEPELAPVLPELLATITRTRYMRRLGATLRRDAVSPV